jgi:hypothetical protein
LPRSSAGREIAVVRPWKVVPPSNVPELRFASVPCWLQVILKREKTILISVALRVYYPIMPLGEST